METPKGPPNQQLDKRRRETSGEEEKQKKLRNDRDSNPEKNEDNGWCTVGTQKGKKKQKETQPNEEQQKPKPRRVRSRGDALIVEVKEGTTYAALLRQVKADPELKELGDNVVKTRRTQKGEMLFELKRDPAVKSAAFKTHVEKSLGEVACVRALTQEKVVECRDMDEITTEDEL